MLIIIAAIAANWVIGKDNDLPWYYPEDLEHFKNITTGHPIIMGWNTYVSILSRVHKRTGKAKPLPKRMHFVLTSKKAAVIKIELQKLFPGFDQESFSDQVIFCSSFGEAVQRAEVLDKEVYVIGGEKVFETAIRDANAMEITEIDAEYDGDAFFPKFDKSLWNREVRKRDGFSFVRYTRKKLDA
nr:Dihydrofolate reductase [uncultured bacterium]